jgi:rubrerythrin
MATFARDAAQASSEMHAADAALDRWMADRALARESTRAELEELVRELATVPELWRHHVRQKGSDPFWRTSPAAGGERCSRACDTCGYVVIEFRPLDQCPMCGTVTAELVSAAVVVAASAA